MGRPGKLFIDWCLDEEHKERKHILDCFVGTKEDLKLYIEDLDKYKVINTDKVKKWEKKEPVIKKRLEDIKISNGDTFWFKCDKCNEIFTMKIKEVKSAIENGAKLHCDDSINSKDVERKGTVYEFLHNGKNDNIELIGLVYSEEKTGIKNCIVTTNGKQILTSVNKRILLKCTIHNWLEEKNVRELCQCRTDTVMQDRQDGRMELECCRYKFTLWDWCLLFYSYIFTILCGLNYSGKYVIKRLRTDNQQKASALLLDENLSVLGNNSIYKFNCKVCGDLEWESSFRKIAYGRTSWCNYKECKRKGCISKDEYEKWNKFDKSFEDFINKYYDYNRKYVEEIQTQYKSNSEDKKRAIKFYDPKRLNTDILRLVKGQTKLQEYVLKLLQSGNGSSNEELRYLKKRKNIIGIILGITQGAEVDVSGTQKRILEKLNEIYDRKKCMSGDNDSLSLVMLIRHNYHSKDGYLSEEEIDLKYYDYVIYLNGFTINKAKNGILYGRPTCFNNKKFKELDSITINRVTFKLVNESQLEEYEDLNAYKIDLKRNTYEKLSPVFNGLLPNSITGVKFEAEFRIPRTVAELDNGSINNCTFSTFLLSSTVLENFHKIYIDKSNKNDFRKEPTVMGRGKISLSYKTSQDNFIQYNDVFKINEHLRVYKDRLTLYRSSGNGGVFQEYEYINGFEYQKFYNSENEMVITIFLSQLNIVKVSEVTEALIDIYNEMNS